MTNEAGVLRLISRLRRRIALTASRCVLRIVNDALKCQGVQISLLDGETRDGVERYQEYGFSSVPASGAEGVAITVGGDRGHLIVVATEDRRYRPKGGQQGEVFVYDKTGSRIHLKTSGDVEITPSSGVCKVTGDLVVTGDVFDSKGSMQEMRDVYNTHTQPHGEPTVGSPTQQMT